MGGVINRIHLAFACLVWAAAAALSPGSAHAQGAGSTVKVIETKDSTKVTVGDYYSQVQLAIKQDFTLPSDDNGRKQWGRAILSAFGLDKKTRSITVSAVMSKSGQALPEVPLLTYLFESDGRLTDIKMANEYVSPRWQLDAASPISITLRYTYSEKLEIDPKSVSEDIAKLIPSNAIVSTLGGTFVQGVAGLAGSVYGATGSRNAATATTNLLLPYSGAIGARKLTYDLRLPNGTKLGQMTATLVNSPSLNRTAKYATAVAAADLKTLPSDDAATLALDLGGSRKFLLTELLGTKEYAALAREQTPLTVSAHCTAAQAKLMSYELTRMDRNLLLIQTMLNAGLTPGTYNATVNDWLPRCFTSAADRTFLKQSMGYNIDLPTAPVVVEVDPSNWPRELKSAMGCHLRKVTGPWCDSHAPNADATLLRSMADEVKIGIIELDTVSTADLPLGRMWPKATLVDRLRNKVDQFSCYEAGLIITEAGQPFLLAVDMQSDKIAGIEILRASEDLGQCLVR